MNNRIITKVAIAGAASVAAVTGIVVATTSGAHAAASGGKVHVFVTPTKHPAIDKIVVAGAIGDFGTATSETASGKPSANGAYVHIKMKHGTFLVNAVAFNNKADNTPPNLDKATCSAWGTLSGNVTLSEGTGSYAGIGGTIKITTSFAFLGPFHKSGPKKGKCNLSQHAKPLAVFNGDIIGSGKVTF